jgi:1-acyl-sn-glycerol-3-phosphate acyltransferase
MSEPRKRPDPRRTLRYWIGWIYLKFFGWRIEGQLPDVPKYVMIAAPHTSYWDTPFMLGVSYVMGARLSFMAKHTMFRGLFGKFFRWLGAIPIDRRARHNVVQ